MKIAICGSMSFLEHMLFLKKKLEKLRHEVVIPKWMADEEEISRNKEADPEAFALMKHEALQYYFSQVGMSEAILVVNLDKHGYKNYIGGNTLMEIGLAVYLEKLIFFLYPVPELPYHDELIGALPIVINNDLALIQEPS